MLITTGTTVGILAYFCDRAAGSITGIVRVTDCSEEFVDLRCREREIPQLAAIIRCINLRLHVGGRCDERSHGLCDGRRISNIPIALMHSRHKVSCDVVLSRDANDRLDEKRLQVAASTRDDANQSHLYLHEIGVVVSLNLERLVPEVVGELLHGGAVDGVRLLLDNRPPRSVAGSLNFWDTQAMGSLRVYVFPSSPTRVRT